MPGIGERQALEIRVALSENPTRAKRREVVFSVHEENGQSGVGQRLSQNRRIDVLRSYSPKDTRKALCRMLKKPRSHLSGHIGRQARVRAPDKARSGGFKAVFLNLLREGFCADRNTPGSPGPGGYEANTRARTRSGWASAK